MKSLLVFFVVVAGLCAGAETGKIAKAATTPAQRTELRLKQTGGRVVDPKSAKGYVAILNSQDKVGIADINGAIASIRSDKAYIFRVVSNDSDAKGAALTIRLINVAGKPPMVAAPEESWAEVNVACLVDDLGNEKAKAKFLPLRARKLLLRAFAYAAGAGGSGYPGNVLDIAEIKDLDYCEEFLPQDTLSLVAKHLKKRGLEPERSCSYLRACEEGWAEQPTNDYQRAIWDRVHEIPSKPIKIEYNEKRDKGK